MHCKICVLGYSEAIAQHLLKKFLLLVYFLDFAKSQHLIKHDPCLFCKDSEYKVSVKFKLLKQFEAWQP